MGQENDHVLDTLCSLTGAQSDAELARQLGISTAAMSKLRSKQSNLSAHTKLKALHLLGYELATQALDAVTDAGFEAHLRARHRVKQPGRR